MLNTSLVTEFLGKHADNCNGQELYYFFNYYYCRYQHGDKHSPVEKFYNCIWYLKHLLTRYNPAEVIEIIYDFEGLRYDKTIVEMEYLYLMNMVVQIHLFNDDFDYAVHWAKKTLEMIDYFHPCLNKPTKEVILKENLYYADSTKLFEKYHHYFDPKLHEEVVFHWEKKFYDPTFHANQNFKYRLFT
jgi:hypothetical protein